MAGGFAGRGQRRARALQETWSRQSSGEAQGSGVDQAGAKEPCEGL